MPKNNPGAYMRKTVKSKGAGFKAAAEGSTTIKAPKKKLEKGVITKVKDIGQKDAPGAERSSYGMKKRPLKKKPKGY